MNAIVFNNMLVVAMILTGCGASDGRRNKTKVQQASQTTQLKMKFRADSAYENIRRQVEMGPRVPGTDAHRRCAEFCQRTRASRM